MSLINDALKRASQVEPPPPSTPLEALRPVHYARVAKLPLILLPIIFIAVLGAAGWFLLKGWEATRQDKVTAMPVAARTASVTVSAAPAAVASRPVETAVEPSLTNANQARVVPAPAIEEVPTFPNLKLQAVFYRPENPTVVINSRILRVGDAVQQAKVVSITREGVVVEWEGEKREFVLP